MRRETKILRRKLSLSLNNPLAVMLVLLLVISGFILFSTVATVPPGTFVNLDKDGVNWNPKVQCLQKDGRVVTPVPVVTTMQEILGTTRRSDTQGASEAGGSFPSISNAGQTVVNGHPWFQHRQALVQPCEAPMYGSKALKGTFVEIHGVRVMKSFYGDNSSGSPAFHSVDLDTTVNIIDNSISPGLKCPDASFSSTNSACFMKEMHIEISGLWKDKKLIPGNASGGGVSEFQVGQVIDIQGFVFWDSGHVTPSSHFGSGWEIHPLTAWRLHQAGGSGGGPDQPPSVTWQSPAGGATITGSSVALTANATDPDQTPVSSVAFQYAPHGSSSFQAIGVPVTGGDSSNNFSTTWNTSGLAAGQYDLRARATDNATAPAVATITVTVSKATASAQCGSAAAPPGRYHHVVWIWMENKNKSDVLGSSQAPYTNRMAGRCGIATNLADNLMPGLPSEPNYAAATSGSNCNTGFASSGTKCIVNDNDYASGNHLGITSIFEQVKAAGGSWRSYQESMPSSCALASSGGYVYKHNPAAFYDRIHSDCQNFDVSIPALSCSSALDQGCSGTPSGAFGDAIRSGNLPTYSFVTPNLTNDMHDGSVAQGDNWLNEYITAITNGPNYRAGDTAVFVMWDEGSSNKNGIAQIPNLVIAPTVPAGVRVGTAVNNVGFLRTTEAVLGLSALGCASGSAPGGGSCPAGSAVDLSGAFNLLGAGGPGTPPPPPPGPGGSSCSSNPSAPGLAAPVLVSGGIALSWSASNPGGHCPQIAGYRVYRGDGTAAPSTLIQTVPGQSYKDTGASPRARYSYLVEAFDAGNPPRTVRSNIVTSASDTTPPTNPTGATATAVGAAQVRLTWSGSTDAGGSGLAGYHLYRSENGGAAARLVDVPAGGSSMTSIDGDVKADTTYQYSVEAFDYAGNVSPGRAATGAVRTAKRTCTTAPSAPSGLHITLVTSNAVSLSWNKPGAACGLAGYRLFRGEELVGFPTDTAYTDADLMSATKYSYKVVAYDLSANVSAASGTVQATTFSLGTGRSNGTNLALTPQGSSEPVAIPDGAVSQVADTLKLAPAAEQLVGATKVEYYLNGKLIATVTRPPFAYKIDTRGYLNGTYTLMLKTYYSDGTTKTTTTKMIVKNALTWGQVWVLAAKFAPIELAVVVLIGLVIGTVVYLRRRAARNAAAVLPSVTAL
ncbi:MAG: phosphoesterase [Patescibacteria group bacterium]|nr:phosphoesterase [Patescibacteria group bacterium]